MQNYAINNKLTPFISMQNFVSSHSSLCSFFRSLADSSLFRSLSFFVHQHNAIYREEEREMFPTVKHFGVGIIPWSPIARGALARPVASEETLRAQTDK